MISKCFSSVLNQSFQDFEVIIIDDGSDDGTEKICDLYSQKYEKVKVWHQNNAGVSAARNVGIHKAVGKYIVFVDCDDWIPINYLRNIKKAYEKFGDEVIYCTSMKERDKCGVHLYHCSTLEYSDMYLENINDLIEKGLFNSPVNKVYCRSVLIRNNIEFPPGLNLGEDLVFNLRYIDCFRKVKFIILNHVYYNVNALDENSLERQWRADYFDIQLSLLKILMRYICKWRKNGKLNCIRQEQYTYIRQRLHWNCIIGSINYYISFIGKRHCGDILKKIIIIRKSQQYLECIGSDKDKIILEMIFSWLKRMGMKYYVDTVASWKNKFNLKYKKGKIRV